MKKLTAEKCREFISVFKSLEKEGHLALTSAYHLQALEIALPILEQQVRGCESCGGNGHVEIDHGELGIEHMTCHKCTAPSGQPEQPTNQNGEQ